jgi:regulator of CtrA degradation
MPNRSFASPQIIENLYCEALVLDDELRATLALFRGARAGELADEATMLTFTSAALRATTAVRGALAWVLVQRSFFAGEISAQELQRHPPRPAQPILAGLDCLPDEIVALEIATRQFYDRIHRVDRWMRLLEAPCNAEFDRLPGQAA